jgi:hypothetical protein
MTISQWERLTHKCILSPAGSEAARILMEGERIWWVDGLPIGKTNCNNTNVRNITFWELALSTICGRNQEVVIWCIIMFFFVYCRKFSLVLERPARRVDEQGCLGAPGVAVSSAALPDAQHEHARGHAAACRVSSSQEPLHGWVLDNHYRVLPYFWVGIWPRG